MIKLSWTHEWCDETAKFSPNFDYFRYFGVYLSRSKNQLMTHPVAFRFVGNRSTSLTVTMVQILGIKTIKKVQIRQNKGLAYFSWPKSLYLKDNFKNFFVRVAIFFIVLIYRLILFTV
jgi:hypothetical protein